jgi:hypothetical protein
MAGNKQRPSRPVQGGQTPISKVPTGKTPGERGLTPIPKVVPPTNKKI